MKHSPLALTLLILFLSPVVSAQAPVLFFSDLINTPKSGLGDGLGQGAIVTIWGKNLGAAQGASKVYIRDSQGTVREAAYVYKWANADVHKGHPADLYTYHKMQYIQFSIPSACADGLGSIYAIVGGVNSSELPLTIRSTGTIRFVKTSGTDSGAGSWSSPWQTLQYAVESGATTNGDIIYATDGVTSTNAYVSNYGLGVGRSKTGSSESTALALLAYPNSNVTIYGTEEGITGAYAEPNYWTFSRLRVLSNGAGIAPFGFGRFIANEITDWACSDSQAGAFYGRYNPDSTNLGQGIKIFGNYIHNWGGSCSTGLHHVIYASFRNAPSPAAAWEIGWNFLKNNGARGGIHFYDEGDCQGWSGITSIHDNVLENQEGTGIDFNTGCNSGRKLGINALVYNNMLIKTGNNAYGQAAAAFVLMCEPAAYCLEGSVRFYNNMIYGYSYSGCPSGDWVCPAVGVWKLSSNTYNFDWYFYNNIIYDLYDNPFYYSSAGWKNPAVTGNNLWYNGGDGNPSSPPSWDTNPLTSNPLFMDPANGDFTPQASSPACGAGNPIIGPDIGAIPCETQCTENWTCTPWSSCTGSQQSRVCSDQNNCGTLVSKPPETQGCVSGPAPSLLFSDMTDGPTSGWESSSTKGAAVSIWGRNFGISRGSSTVTVCGVTLNQDSDFAEWGATTNPTVPLGMQRITFWLRSDMLTAGSYPNSNIVVTTQDGASESIPFHCRALGTNKIYFFSASGSDSNSGLTTTSPKRTPGWFRDNAQAGDTAYFRSVGGTYGNDIRDNEMGYSNSHMMFYHSPGYFNNGIEGKSITVTSYPGEMAYWLAADIGSAADSHTVLISTKFGAVVNYWTFSKLQMKSTWACFDMSMSGGSSNLRVIGNDVTTSYVAFETAPYYGCGLVFQGGALGGSYMYVLGNYIHDLSSDYRGQVSGQRIYGMYLGGYGAIDHFYFGHNEVGWNYNGRGIQIYGHTPTDSLSNAYVYNNWIHDVGRQCAVLGNGDGGPNFIRSLWVYNNICSNPDPGDVTILVGGGETDQTLATIYFYNNALYHPSSTNRILNIAGSPTLYLRNNIIYGGNEVGYYTYYPDSSCTRCTGDHNIYYGGSSKPSWDTSTLDNVNPQFISSNPTTYADFFPQSTSPAIDAGTSGVQAVVSRDFLGLPRPQGTSYDIGAYEYSSGQMSCIHESDNNPCNGCISPSELTAYIDRWKFDNQDVTIKDLIDAIGWWKRSGC